MALPRSRWLLPGGHTLVDVVVLLAFIGQGRIAVQWEKSAIRPVTRISPVWHLQDDGGTYSWDPHFEEPALPPGFVLFVTGTLPAGWASAHLRPNAFFQNRRQLWDPVWFMIHEAIAIPFWLLIGVRLDTYRSWVSKLVCCYLGARCLFAVIFFSLHAASFGVIIQCLVWLVLAVIAVTQSIVKFASLIARKLASQ